MIAKAHEDVRGVLDAYDFSKIQPHRRRRLWPTTYQGDHRSEPGCRRRAVRASRSENGSEPAAGLKVVAGDFFNDPLPTADAYIFTDIIHDWDDKHALQNLGPAGPAPSPGHCTEADVRTSVFSRRDSLGFGSPR